MRFPICIRTQNDSYLCFSHKNRNILRSPLKQSHAHIQIGKQFDIFIYENNKHGNPPK